MGTGASTQSATVLGPDTGAPTPREGGHPGLLGALAVLQESEEGGRRGMCGLVNEEV